MAFVSKTTYDFFPCRRVPVIASFNLSGQLKPLYVRIDDQCLKIDSCWQKSEGFCPVVEYHCLVVTPEGTRPLILEYHSQERIWVLPVEPSHPHKKLS